MVFTFWHFWPKSELDSVWVPPQNSTTETKRPIANAGQFDQTLQNAKCDASPNRALTAAIDGGRMKF
jgi:hypothetical protein